MPNKTNKEEKDVLDFNCHCAINIYSNNNSTDRRRKK
jgi:hypothetical protein